MDTREIKQLLGNISNNTVEIIENKNFEEKTPSETVVSPYWYDGLSKIEFARLIRELIMGDFLSENSISPMIQKYIESKMEHLITSLLDNEVERSTFFGMIITFSRFPTKLVNEANLLYIFAIAMNLADKSFSDIPLSLKDYANFMEVDPEKLGRMQMRFCEHINYRVFMGTKEESVLFNQFIEIAQEWWKESQQLDSQNANSITLKLTDKNQSVRPKRKLEEDDRIIEQLPIRQKIT